MTRKKIKKVLPYLLFGAFILFSLYILERLLMPKYMEEPLEGAMVAEYYGEEMSHDVLFIGDCEVYENISPVTLWQEYGINSYIRGSANQLVWQSYYLLEDALRYETPKVVVFNVLAMKYGTPQNEAYNRMTLDGMRWSASKWKAVEASMTPEEHFAEYLFPILRFHSRITELTKEDFIYLFQKRKVTYNGYLMQTGVRPVQVIPEGKPLSDTSFSDTAWEYLDKMADLCEENQIEFVLIKAPVLYPYWYEEWEEQIVDYAARRGIKYYNFLENVEEIGIDFQTDTYDGGLHLNVYGAEKLSVYFGKILEGTFEVPNRRGENKLEEAWEKKIRHYEKEKAGGL